MAEASDTKRKSRDQDLHDSPCASWFLGIILLVQSGLLAFGAWVQSPTLNEPGHLAAGLSNWHLGRFDTYRVNPPLVRLVAALPVILAGAETDWRKFSDIPGTRTEFRMGEDFVAANGQRSLWLFTLARWACIPFSIIGGWTCFAWGRSLYGDVAGLLAASLWCICPNLLGHGQLITNDVAGTALGILACYAFWRWLQRPTWKRTLLSGLALGIAEIAKMTLIVFVPLWFVLWLAYRWPDRQAMSWRRWGRELGMLALRFVFAVYVINSAYGFEKTLTPLGQFRFVSATLGAVKGTAPPLTMGGNRFAGTWLASVPVPLPANYVLGIDLQKREFESYREPSYLNGTFSEKGWWYYYLYALAIKVPLGTWVLFGLASTKWLWGWDVTVPSRQPSVIRSHEPRGQEAGDVAEYNASPPPPRPFPGRREGITWRDEFVLLSSAAIIVAFVSSQTGFSEHMRYVLPAFPFVFIWIGRIVPALDRRHRMVATIAVSAFTWSVVSSLWVFPHSLSYFNELVGGPRGGPAHLIHSNVDWGQDLQFLKQWLDRHPNARPLKLAYFGYFDPRFAGIEYSAPRNIPPAEEVLGGTAKIPPGWFAISVNVVQGLPYFLYQGDGTKAQINAGALAAFNGLKPAARAGYSIYIYHSTADDHQ